MKKNPPKLTPPPSTSSPYPCAPSPSPTSSCLTLGFWLSPDQTPVNNTGQVTPSRLAFTPFFFSFLCTFCFFSSFLPPHLVMLASRALSLCSRITSDLGHAEIFHLKSFQTVFPIIGRNPNLRPSNKGQIFSARLCNTVFLLHGFSVFFSFVRVFSFGLSDMFTIPLSSLILI